MTEDVRKKIGLFCNVPTEMVIEARDIDSVYKVPLMFHEGGLDQRVVEILGLDAPSPDLEGWKEIVRKMGNPSSEVDISICGKYVEYPDSYKSIREAFVHAGISNDVRVNVEWLDSGRITRENAHERLSKYAGILIPGGFGPRGVEGMIETVRYARENNVPYFGICLGLHSAVIEFARNVCGLSDSHSAEFDEETQDHVIDLMPEQNGIVRKGGTMRLGSYPCRLAEGSLARRIYGCEEIDERHRHRFEVNNKYLDIFLEKGLVFSGMSPDRSLIEIIELRDHPWFLACQFHPEFKSRPTRTHPLFRDFVRAAIEYREGCDAGERN
jgi:CTP synthase